MGRKCIDYTGQEIGNLHIVKRLPNRKPKETLWFAKCKCGADIEITSRSIKNQSVPSCGCKRPLNKGRCKKSPLERTLNKYYSDYVYRAKKSNLKWEIDEFTFNKLVRSHCEYCGIEPCRSINIYDRKRFKNVKSKESKKRHEKGIAIVNGIDRIDSDEGYTRENVVSCCQDCNYGKYTKTPEQFLNWIKRVYKYNNE